MHLMLYAPCRLQEVYHIPEGTATTTFAAPTQVEIWSALTNRRIKVNIIDAIVNIRNIIVSIYIHNRG